MATQSESPLSKLPAVYEPKVDPYDLGVCPHCGASMFSPVSNEPPPEKRSPEPETHSANPDGEDKFRHSFAKAISGR